MNQINIDTYGINKFKGLFDLTKDVEKNRRIAD